MCGQQPKIGGHTGIPPDPAMAFVGGRALAMVPAENAANEAMIPAVRRTSSLPPGRGMPYGPVAVRRRAVIVAESE